MFHDTAQDSKLLNACGECYIFASKSLYVKVRCKVYVRDMNPSVWKDEYDFAFTGIIRALAFSKKGKEYKNK